MDLSVRVLGSHIAHQLRARTDTPVLTIGRDRFTRGDLAGVECFNYLAAANLSAALATFQVTSTKDVFDRIAPRALALPRIGAIALAVLGAAFEAKGLGGDAPLEAWVTKHRDAASRKAFVTFDTIKHQTADAKANRQARRATTARTRGRRSEAHRLRVKRFTRRVSQ